MVTNEDVAVVVHTIAPGAAGAQQSLKILAKIIRQYRYHPLIIQYARLIIKNVPHKDYPGQAEAILSWVQLNINFVRDPVGRDMNQTPEITLAYGSGDCDDLVILLCSLLESIGHPCMLIGIQEPGAATYNHVVAATRIGTRWLCMDPSEPLARMGDCPAYEKALYVYV